MTSPNIESRILIVMAGLPGTGKSTIAGELARRLQGLVLNKDEIRARLFSREDLDYSQTQDDHCMDVIFLIAEYVLQAAPGKPVIIDGRTFSKKYQIEHLRARTGALGLTPVLIECTCDESITRQRLERDQAVAAHPAGNRSFVLYLELKEKAEPLTAERLVLDTGGEPVEQSVARCMTYLQGMQRQRS